MQNLDYRPLAASDITTEHLMSTSQPMLGICLRPVLKFVTGQPSFWWTSFQYWRWS